MIQINMDMPKSCSSCRFRWFGMCTATDNAKGIFKQNPKRRPSWCPLQEVKGDKNKGESMENNKNCTNCIHYKVDEINTVDKSNPRGICYALPVTTVVRHREMPCIYYKENGEVKD